MIIGGDYLYPRLKYVWEYTEQKDHDGLQIKETLDDAKAKEELFEHELLSMKVFYEGFHKPWNKGVVDKDSKVQAAFIQAEVKKHKECARSVEKRQAFWRTHAKDAIVGKRLFEWEHDQYQEKDRVWPTEQAIAARKEELTAEVTDDVAKIPTCVLPRVKCVHLAIVEKAEELLADIVSSGKAPAATVAAGAPNTNMPVEDIFQKMRYLHDRCAITRVGVLSAHRRVQRAPDLGGEGDDAHRFALDRLPDWFPDWLSGMLKGMARDEISEWPSQQKRADLRWQRTQDLSDLKKGKREKNQEKQQQRQDALTSAEGGMVVLEGEEEEPVLLPAMRRLTLAEFESVNWEKGAAPTWTKEKIINQMRLHNLPTHKFNERSDELDKKLVEKEMIAGAKSNLKLTFASREAAHKYLRAYLQLQKQVSEMVSEMERVRARAEQQDGRNSRSSRRTRGSAARSDEYEWGG